MGAADASIEIHRDVLGRDPSNEAALAALERLLATPAHQPVITEILEPIYRDANEFTKLVGVLEIQTQHASAPAVIQCSYRAKPSLLVLLGYHPDEHRRISAPQPGREFQRGNCARLVRANQ